MLLLDTYGTVDFLLSITTTTKTMANKVNSSFSSFLLLTFSQSPAPDHLYLQNL